MTRLFEVMKFLFERLNIRILRFQVHFRDSDDAFAVPFADVTFGAESAAGKLSFENEIVEMDFPVDEHRFKGGLFISEGGSAILNFLRAISRARRILELLDRVGRLDLVRERVVRSQTRRLIVVFGIVERKRHRAELEIVVRKFRILLERRRLRVRSIMIRKNAVFSFCAHFGIWVNNAVFTYSS